MGPMPLFSFAPLAGPLLAQIMPQDLHYDPVVAMHIYYLYLALLPSEDLGKVIPSVSILFL